MSYIKCLGFDAIKLPPVNFCRLIALLPIPVSLLSFWLATNTLPPFLAAVVKSYNHAVEICFFSYLLALVAYIRPWKCQDFDFSSEKFFYSCCYLIVLGTPAIYLPFSFVLTGNIDLYSWQAWQEVLPVIIPTALAGAFICFLYLSLGVIFWRGYLCVKHR